MVDFEQVERNEKTICHQIENCSIRFNLVCCGHQFQILRAVHVVQAVEGTQTREYDEVEQQYHGNSRLQAEDKAK